MINFNINDMILKCIEDNCAGDVIDSLFQNMCALPQDVATINFVFSFFHVGRSVNW